MINDTELQIYAQDIAKLTFDIEKLCRTKEVMFCETINLTPIEFRVLRFLLKSNSTQVKELSSSMELTPARVTTLLNSLEKKSYIKREVSKSDRRITDVSLTQSGKKFAQDIQEQYVKFHENILLSINNDSKLKDMLCSLEVFQSTLEAFLKK